MRWLALTFLLLASGTAFAQTEYNPGDFPHLNSQNQLRIPGNFYVGPIASSGYSWLEALIPNTSKIGQIVGIRNTGQGFGIIGAGRTSDSLYNGTDVFGVGGFAYCNTLTGGPTNKGCWSFYGETRRLAGSIDQFSHVAEIDMVNFDTAVVNGPYSIAPSGITPDLWLSCGRPDVVSPTNCTTAIGIVNNGAQFVTGIMFQSTSVLANGGVSNAIVLPKSYAIAWQEPGTSTQVAQIRSDVTVAGNGGNMIWGNGALYFQNHDASLGLQLTDLAGSTNYVVIFPSIGSTPGITTNAGGLFLGSAGNAAAVTLGTGAQIGAPTGGDKGVGTVNLATAQGLYNNNTATTGTGGGYVVATAPTITTATLTDAINQEHHVGSATTVTTNTTLASITGLSQSLTAGKSYECSGWIHFTTVPTTSNGVKLALATSDTLTVTTLAFNAFAYNGVTAVVGGNTYQTVLGTATFAFSLAMTDIYLKAAIVVNAAGTLQVQIAENASSVSIVTGPPTWSCVRVN
jgi:hypothetical protein